MEMYTPYFYVSLNQILHNFLCGRSWEIISGVTISLSCCFPCLWKIELLFPENANKIWMSSLCLVGCTVSSEFVTWEKQFHQLWQKYKKQEVFSAFFSILINEMTQILTSPGLDLSYLFLPTYDITDSSGWEKKHHVFQLPHHTVIKKAGVIAQKQ